MSLRGLGGRGFQYTKPHQTVPNISLQHPHRAVDMVDIPPSLSQRRGMPGEPESLFSLTRAALNRRGAREQIYQQSAT